MMLALAVAFWLQLDGASSAGTCVAILSLQTRGQAFHKAVYRMVGTVVGVVASIAIAGLFSQARDLFFLATCIWLGLCAALASLLDGNRAYGAVLSGYTVAIVALPNIDTPLDTFSSGINRGAAITIGILAVAVISDFFWAPNLYPTVLKKLEAAHDKARSFAVKALQSRGAAPGDAAALLREITALHPDVTALPAESVSGQARYEAACLATTSLLRMASAARVVAGALAALGEAGDEPRANLVKALQGQPHDSVRQRALNVMAMPEAPSYRLIASSACLVLFEQHRQTAVALDAMRTGRQPAHTTHLVLYKSRRAALRNGLRAGLALAISALLLSLSGWPATTTALVQIGALVGLSATNPNPRGFAVGALIAMPLVAAAAGITEFLILDGVDQFELLVLGMGPTIIIASLLLAAGKPLLYGIGFLLLVFFPVLMSIANPQSYNPQTYLFGSFLSVLAVIALFLLLSTVLPTSDARQRGWIFASARADLRDALFGPRRRFDSPACAFRDADRIGQFSGLKVAGTRDRDLRYLIRMSDLAACARRVRTALDSDRVLRAGAGRARAALAALEPHRLRELGREMLLASRDGPDARRGAQRRAAIDLLFAATLIERSPRVVAELRERGAG